MMSLLIVAILASVAYPTYKNNVLKARRVDAQCTLMAFASAMERYYLQNNSYLGAAAVGGNTGVPGVFSATAPLGGSAASYDLTINTVTATSYTLMATPKGNREGDLCGALTLTDLGVKGIVNAANGISVSACW